MIKKANIVLVALLSITLTACASGARPDKMVASPVQAQQISASNKYFKSIAIEDVTGGKKTNPMWTSEVSDTAFKSALAESLRAHGLLNENGNPKYALNTKLVAVEQPLIGINFTVTSIVDYQLKTASNQIAYEKTIEKTGKATMGDSVLGVERLKIANEYSIKNNIQAFIDDIK